MTLRVLLFRISDLGARPQPRRHLALSSGLNLKSQPKSQSQIFSSGAQVSIFVPMGSISQLSLSSASTHNSRALLNDLRIKIIENNISALKINLNSI